MKENDYVIGQSKNAKPFLIQVKEIGQETVTGVLEKNRHTDPKTVEVDRKDIFLNLGPRPTPGKAYGFDLANIYLKSFDHEFWGTIACFTRLDKANLTMFKNSLDRTAKIVEKQRLTSFVDRFRTEVRARHGKYAGMYHHDKDDPFVWYAPEWCQSSAGMMDYVILHEFGHVLRFQGVTSPKLRSQWLKVFKRSIARTKLENPELKTVFAHLREVHTKGEDESFAKVLKSAFEDDDNHQKFKTLTRWFTQIHHMSLKDLSILWAADDLTFLEDKLWPTSAIDSSDLAPIISEYATRNVEETFAESYAFFSTGKKLPTPVPDLLDESLSYARKRAKQFDAEDSPE